MKHTPGSFTKNFAWRGEGFRRLHEVTRAGFSGTLQAVATDEWRHNCGEPSASLQLVPLNFFLHQAHTNERLVIPVDELVYQSISAPHSLAFDRLALFAFHLNSAGIGAARKNLRGWATWANEFVREDLWVESGGWGADKLADSQLFASLQERIDAQPQALTKCFTNYRYFFALAEYLGPRGKFVNTGFEEWLASALFLTWDRWLLEDSESAYPNVKSLLSVVTGFDVHKLVGAPFATVTAQAEVLASTYLQLGALARFSDHGSVGFARSGAAKKKPRKKQTLTKEQAAKAALDRMASLRTVKTDATVERQIREYQTQIRNRLLAATIKKLYGDSCFFCESSLQIGRDPDVHYVEAAHIRPLGSLHNGADIAENIIPLCPNHHLQFDRGMLRIRCDNGTFKIDSQLEGDPLHGKTVKLQTGHSLDLDCVNYHFDWFARTRKRT